MEIYHILEMSRNWTEVFVSSRVLVRVAFGMKVNLISEHVCMQRSSPHMTFLILNKYPVLECQRKHRSPITPLLFTKTSVPHYT